MRVSRTPRFSWFLATLVVVVALPGCKPRAESTAGTEMTPPPTTAPTPEPTPTAEMNARNDVKIVVIRPGMPKPIADPDKVEVGADRQIVVWVAAGKGSITSIHFDQSPFPGGQQPTCRGRFCWTSGPPESRYINQSFPYQVTANFEGQTQTTDPNVEVIP